MKFFSNPLQSEFDILYVVWDRIEKEGWKPGSYHNEPDYLKLLHKRTKSICYIRRIPYLGTLCGYVEVDRNHAMYGRDYMNLPPGDCAHGGVTFSEYRSVIRKRKKQTGIPIEFRMGRFYPGEKELLDSDPGLGVLPPLGPDPPDA